MAKRYIGYIVLDWDSLEIEVYTEGASLPAFWLYPYKPGEAVHGDEEVMEAPDWVAEEVGKDHLLYLVPRALVPELEALGFRLGTYFGDLGEVCPKCGGILSPSPAWANWRGNWPWTPRPPLGHREGCLRIRTADVGTEE